MAFCEPCLQLIVVLMLFESCELTLVARSSQMPCATSKLVRSCRLTTAKIIRWTASIRQRTTRVYEAL